MDRKHCRGCRNNFYNANNDLGVGECWSLKDAKLVVRREVHISQVPPWNQKVGKFPNCYHKPQFVYVAADRKY